MTKLKLLLSLTALFLVFTSKGQCPNGTMYFETQGQVDSFIINYPNCTDPMMGIIISFADVTNLEGFRNLRSINGQIQLNENLNLTSLEGFRNISKVSQTLRIRNCPLITNLSGLRSMESLGSFILIDCDSLKNLIGLDSMKTIENDLDIHFNDNLSNLEGLHNTEAIFSGISIKANPKLKNLTGLRNLQFLSSPDSMSSGFTSFSVIRDNINLESLDGLENIISTGGLVIDNNTKLTNLLGLSSLSSIRKWSLTITNNQNLQSLEGAPLLKHINGKIDIRNNPSLTSLSGLDEVDATAITDLIIKDNESLSSCAIYSICEYLDLDGPRDIEFNLEGCNTEMEIQDACELVATSEINPKLLHIDISPVPTQDYLQVSIDPLSEVSQFRYFIYDTMGKELLSGRSYSHHTSIDVSCLRSGVYTILIDVEGSRAAQLWVKI